eukprot:CAMPEP_0115108580 /NCGR_PEP_ID=MMETSP0227-20121206/38092_1 /TAXON_ID=89957 /ORGANISM="Polarella glacialis, Strain CCMP 1383" /LENGTH=130 /DNA_ID=CAMNT_0002506909 /DNA_START=80 /DNA_END=472 /DNA_ORIENTATION=+
MAAVKELNEEAEKYKGRGNDFFKAGDWEKAVKEYNKAITLDPGNAVYYSNRSGAWSSKGSHQSALRDAEKCIELDPQFAKGYARKAKALFDTFQTNDAEAAYKEGLKVDPTNAACLTGLADVQASRGPPK